MSSLLFMPVLRYATWTEEAAVAKSPWHLEEAIVPKVSFATVRWAS